MKHHWLRVMGGAAGGGYTPVDADAASYITAVEAADTQALEDGVREAIDDFVIGCKADSIWAAIQACCIMAGARTRDGTMVPLKGAAPTEFGTAGDWNYNRETGLAGNGTNNYRDSSNTIPTDQQNNCHVAYYASTNETAGRNMGWVTSAGAHGTWIRNTGCRLYNNGGSTLIPSNQTSTGFRGASRQGTTPLLTYRAGGANQTSSIGSFEVTHGNLAVFARKFGDTTDSYSNARLSFYSIGTSIDLALLDARVTTLMADIAAAI